MWFVGQHLNDPDNNTSKDNIVRSNDINNKNNFTGDNNNDNSDEQYKNNNCTDDNNNDNNNTDDNNNDNFNTDDYINTDENNNNNNTGDNNYKPLYKLYLSFLNINLPLSRLQSISSSQICFGWG